MFKDLSESMIKSKRGKFKNEWGGQTSFTCSEVEEFWSYVAEEMYEEANENFMEAHIQRFEISIPQLDIPEYGNLLNLWSRQGEAIPYLRNRFNKMKIFFRNFLLLNLYCPNFAPENF